MILGFGLGYVISTCYLYPVFWLLLGLVLLLHILCRDPRCLPPRPRGVPVLGNAFSIPSNVPLYRWCMEQTKHFGPVIRVTMGLQDAVFLNDRDSMHEALVENAWVFSGRPTSTALELLSGDLNNVSFTDPDNPTWRLRRKMLVTSLRNFTTGSAYETRIQESLASLTDMFDEQARCGQAFDPAHALRMFVYSYSANLCYGKSFSFDEPELIRLHASNQEFANAMDRVYSTDVLPFLRYFPFDMPDVAQLRRSMAEPINNFIRARFQEHFDNPSDEASDLTYYLLKMKRESDDPLMSDVTDANIREIASEIFNAGTDTSRGTLQWLLLALSRRPDLQSMLHQQIIDVCGVERQKLHGRSVFSVKSELDLVEAMLTEVFRFGTVAPVGLPRKTLRECRIGKYDIPKGTTVFINQYAVNHDPAHFSDPLTFNPTRHLVDTRSQQVAFGLGRRSCPGEVAAKSTIFYILVHLLDRYQLLPGDEQKLSDHMYMDSMFDGSPKPFKIKVKGRWN